jgi:hypothetical protein
MNGHLSGMLNHIPNVNFVPFLPGVSCAMANGELFLSAIPQTSVVSDILLEYNMWGQDSHSFRLFLVGRID